MKTFRQLREEIQLDEISMDLRQRAAGKAAEKMDAIRNKYPAKPTGDQSISAVPGITKSDKDEWVKTNKQSSIFKGYTKPKVPRNQLRSPTKAEPAKSDAARSIGTRPRSSSLVMGVFQQPKRKKLTKDKTHKVDDHTDIVVQYRMSPDKVPYIYGQFGLNVDDKILGPGVNEAFKAEIGRAHV